MVDTRQSDMAFWSSKQLTQLSPSNLCNFQATSASCHPYKLAASLPFPTMALSFGKWHRTGNNRMDVLAFPAAKDALTTYWMFISEVEKDEQKFARDRSVFAANQGIAARKPVESAYNAVRRFFGSNPAIAPNRLIDEVRRSLAVTGYIEHSLSQERPWLSRCSSGISGHKYPEIRNCPICATHQYHSSLFQLKWFEICPIHKCSLIANCPSCGLRWPNYREVMARKCDTCGLTNFTGSPASLSNRGTSFDSLIVISKLLHEQADFPEQYYDFCDKDYPCNISKDSRLIIHSIIVDHPESEALLRSVSASVADVKQHRIKNSNAPCSIAFRHPALETAQTNINGDLRKEILLLSEKHLAKSYKLKTYDVENFSFNSTFCPACMAASIALYLLTYSDSRHKYAQLDSMALPHFIHSASGIPLPTMITEIKGTNQVKAKAQQIPIEATFFLYRLAWLKLYERIFNYCLWVNEANVRKSLAKGFELDVPEKTRFWLPRSIGFELQIEDGLVDIFHEVSSVQLTHQHQR